MSEDLIQTGVVLTFAVEGEETVVAAATVQDGLTASVEQFAASATSAYAQATAAQKSVIDSYRQQAAAAQAAQASSGAQIKELRASIAELDAYAAASASAGEAGVESATLAAEAAQRLRLQLNELTAAQLEQTAAAKEAAMAQAAAQKLVGSSAAIQGYLAQADAIVTSNTALGLQQIQLQEIAVQLRKDTAAFALLGDEGIAAADESAEALRVVQAALASIAAEQKVVIDGMAGIAAASGVAGAAAEAGMGKEIAKETAKLAGIESGIIGMAAKMAPLAAGIGFAILTKDAIEYAASLEHMHEKLGVSTEALSAFNVAAKENDMDVQEMNRSIAMLFKNIDLALHPGGKKQLVNLSEMLGMSTAQTVNWAKTSDATKVLLDTFTAIDKIPDPVTRLAKAQELLGRTAGAGQLLNAIHSLAGDGFGEATKKARELNVEVDELTAKNALEFKRSIIELKEAFVGVGLTVAQLVLELKPLVDLILKANSLTPSHKDSAAGLAYDAMTLPFNPMAQIRTIGRLEKLGDDAASYVASGHWLNSLIGIPPPPPAPAPNLLQHLENIDRTPPLTDEQKTKREEILKLAQDQLDIAIKQYAVASATNVVIAQQREYELKRTEILKEFDKQKGAIDSQLAKGEIDAGTATIAIAQDRLAMQQKLNTASVEYANQVRETARAESEAVRSLSDQLAMQRLQTAAAGGASALMKEQLSYAEKQLQIQNDLDAATRRITAPGPNSLPRAEQEKQLAGERAIAEQKLLAAKLDTLSATQRILLAEAATTREMNLAADAEERNVQLAQNAIALELLNRAAIQTTGDVQRVADIEKQNALIQLADKRAQIDEAERRAIEEQAVVIADFWTRAMSGLAIDPAAFSAAYARIAALQKKFNAERVTAETQTQGAILNGEFQAIQKKNEALAEARYSNSIMAAQQAANDAAMLANLFGDPISRAFADVAQQLVDDMKKAADQANAIWRTVGDNISQGFSTLFSTLSRGGGLSAAFKDMGQQFESSFGNIIESRIKKWADDLTRMAQNQPLLNADGTVMKDSKGNVKYGYSADQQNRAQLGLGALTAAQIGIAGYSAGSGHGQATMSAVTGGITGATIGAQIGAAAGGITVVAGAVVGAVIGVIASVIGSAIATAQKQSEYLYGIPQFVNGKAAVTNERNINPQKSTEITAQLQDSFNTAWNGFVVTMGKLGGGVPSMPSFINGTFQPNPSANWEKHFQQYLTDTLPATIAGMFKAGMEKSFVSNGLTSDAFGKFWDEAMALDPSKRMQFWQDLSDGIVSFAHAQATFDAVKRLGGDYAGAKFDTNGNPILSIDNDFMASLRTGAKQVYDIARNMVSLTGPDRIAAFKQMGAAVDQITASFAQFIQQVGASIKAVRQQFSDAFLAHDLAMTGEDKNKQARILEADYNQTKYKIDHASQLGLNPQDIEALTQRGISDLNQIFALDPSAAADQWWQKQMATLQASSEAALKLMGDYATTEMQKFLDSIKPFKDYMLGIPVEIDPSIVALEKEFDGLAAAIAALTVSIVNHTPGGDTSGGGGDGNGGVGGGGGTIKFPGDGTDGGNSIGGTVSAAGSGDVNNYYFNGTFVGMEEFQNAINNANALDHRENPQKYTSTF